MCGIAGIVEFYDRSCGVGDLLKMVAIQHHRGPDGAAYYHHENVFLGHNRLRIIDLSDAAIQPMTNEDGTLWLVFNGEIYNFRELREELLRQGHRFKSRSDSEVLVHLYEEKGHSMVEDLNGIFAFALFDLKASTLFLARDHFGIKPLYFSHTAHRFVFASEIKALLAAGVEKKIDAEAFHETLIFTQVAGRRTLFQSVQRLLPGETLSLEIGSGRATRRRYWTPRILEETTTADAVERIHDCLVRAVRRQLVADVPVGTICSGGIDSSLISALASREMTGQVDTYVIEVEDPRFNEVRYANLVSAHIRSHHHILKTCPVHADSMLPLAIWLHDEPLCHGNSIPILQISLLAKDQVTVLLSGEGADEMYGGYGHQKSFRTIRRLRKIVPPSLVRLLEPQSWYLHSWKLARALQRIGAPDLVDSMVFSASWTSPAALSHWGLPIREAWSYRRELAAEALRLTQDPVLAHMLYDQQTFLQTLLDRQDKMSMGASIESRVPFLDIPLVEATNSMGMAIRHWDGINKWVLREIGRQYLPQEIFSRPKHAFGLPLAEWLRTSGLLAKRSRGLVSGHLVRAGLIPNATMKQVAELWEGGNNTVAGLVWTLVNLEIWWDLFIEGELPSHLDILPSHGTRHTATHPTRIE
jgi:asparagine synthase (glutamine-hydrolysing)